MRRRYRVSITRGGYVYIFLTIVISVGAVNTGNNLLYLVSSLMLSLMLVSGLSSLANLVGVGVEVRLPQEVFAGIPAPVEVKLTRKNRVFPSVLVGLGLDESRTRGLFLPPGGASAARLWITFGSRGIHRLSHLELYSGFPFGFFVRTRYFSLEKEVVVFPSPVSTALFTSGEAGRGEVSAVERRGAGDEVLDLRGYRPGDPVKQMDWKATARRGGPVVREMASLAGEEVEVVLSGDAPEEDLGKATYLVVEGLKRGFKVGLVLGEKRFPPGMGQDHRRRLLTALAVA